MKKKRYLSNGAIVSIGVLALVITGVLGLVFMHPDNDSDISRWLRTNFFPADEYGTTSLLDMDQSAIAEQEYRGSMPGAWILCGVLSLAVIVISALYLAKERRLI